MTAPLPPTLESFAEMISGAAGQQAAVEFVPDTWRRWLTAPSKDGGGAMPEHRVDQILGRFPDDQVSRGDVRAIALEGSLAAANRELFIAAMIWGRGKSNGRMLPHVMRAMRSSAFDDTLAATADFVADGQLEAAYLRWQLPGLREPFFTKWFWALACRPHTGLTALVLDGRVWRTLSALGWNSIDAAGSTRRAMRYLAYVRTAHAWASGLSQPEAVVTAEDVEFSLFFAAGDLTRLRQLRGRAAA